MKSILITGACGFIGSHLVEFFLEKGYYVRALVQYNSFNNWGWLDYIGNHENLEIITGDIRDPHLCNSITKDIDIVFHLAALIAIPYSYYSPDSYVDTNIKGTLNMCHSSRENNVELFVHTSTSEVYGTARYVPIDENHPKQSQSPYSASKIAADAIVTSFINSYNLPATIARPFNTFGPRQSARAFIPSIIIQILEGKKTIRVGNLKPTRDMNYVKDTCKGLYSLTTTNQVIGKEINISSNFEISMLDIFSKIKLLLNSDVNFETDDERIRPNNSEVYRLWGDNSLIKKLTGFRPEFNFEKGLKETIDWFSIDSNRNKFKAQIFNQ